MTHPDDRRAFSVSAIRAAEQPVIAAAPTDAIMRRAAWAVADLTRTVARGDGRARLYGAPVAALVGAGDNGGDALYALEVLARDGAAAHALLLAPDRAHPRALAAARRAGVRIYDTGTAADLTAALERIAPRAVIDGIVGLGAVGAPRPLAALAARLLAASETPVVAVDVPSGVDPETGHVHEGAITPLATVTFGLWRRAHLLAGPACGTLVCADVGIPEPGTVADTKPDTEPGLDAEPGTAAAVLHSLGEATVGAQWPVPGPHDDKYTQGVVAIRAGSPRYPGAAVLCTGAAVAATSAMVRYVGPAGDAVLGARPEIVAAPDVNTCGQAQAWVVGPGAGTDAVAVQELATILAQDLPTVLDADALRVLATHPSTLRRRTAPLVLTPHAGEFAALARTFAPPAGERLATDRAGAVRMLTAALSRRGVDVTVLLKGRVTLVDDRHTAFAQDAGTSWAATPGSGDVLSGVIGALLAARAAGGIPPTVSVPQTVAMAQVVHSLAARLAAEGFGRPGAPIGASDLLDALPAAVTACRAVAQ